MKYWALSTFCYLTLLLQPPMWFLFVWSRFRLGLPFPPHITVDAVALQLSDSASTRLIGDFHSSVYAMSGVQKRGFLVDEKATPEFQKSTIYSIELTF